MERKTVLYAGFEQALAARKNEAVLGTTFTTPFAFVSDAWDVWGDARAIIGSVERRLLVAQLLYQGEYSFVRSISTVNLIADFIARAAGCSGYMQLVDHVGDETHLSPAEREVAQLVRAYHACLNDAGFIELGDAARILSDIMPHQHVRIGEPLDLIPAIQHLINQLDADAYAKAIAIDTFEVAPLPADVEPRFLFPAGQTAVIPAIYQEIMRALQSDAVTSLAVCAKDAYRMYTTLAPVMALQGVNSTLRCRFPFAQTTLARALDAVRTIAAGDAHWEYAAVDFAYNPFAHMSLSQAEHLDTTIRADRLYSCNQAIQALKDASSTYALFERIVNGALSDALLAASELSAYAQEHNVLYAAVRVRESAALALLIRYLESACAQGSTLSPTFVIDMLNTASFALSLRSKAADSLDTATCREVSFVSYAYMKELLPASFDEVIITDMTNSAFAPKEEKTALDELSATLGIPSRSSQTGMMRYALSCAEAAACRTFAVCMPQRDDNAGETYPSFLYNEYLSALFFACGYDGEPKDEQVFNLPVSLAKQAVFLGEDDIVAGLGSVFVQPTDAVVYDNVIRGALKNLKLEEFLRSVSSANGSVPVLSPSAIEVYLQCPYKWFLERRIGANEIDEYFGAREKGTFVHALLAAFYDAVAHTKDATLAAMKAEDAHELFDQVFSRMVDQQAKLPAGERLVAANHLEVHEIELLRQQLHDTLDYLRKLPENYHSVLHEYIISPEDGIDYAGIRLNGRIDRIDTDTQAKQFYVLDYKGQSKKYAAGGSVVDDVSTFGLPDYVQALIYAQAYAKAHPDMTPLAALYAGYSTKVSRDFLAGSYNRRVGNIACLAKEKSVIESDFSCYLHQVEEAIRLRLTALRTGDIAPTCSNEMLCNYCIYTACEGGAL